MKRIEITVLPDGQSKVETFGYSGSACREASRLIEQALGQSTGEELKSEFYLSRQSNEQSTRQG